jgi:hypothetical protein
MILTNVQSTSLYSIDILQSEMNDLVCSSDRSNECDKTGPLGGSFVSSIFWWICRLDVPRWL